MPSFKFITLITKSVFAFSFGYSTFSLEALMDLATIAQSVGVDLWTYHSPRGGSIQGAVDCLLPFALKQSEWKHATISGFKPFELSNDLLMTAVAYRSQKYEAAAKSIRSTNDAHRMLLAHEFAAVTKTGSPS
jgi:hypothetical protein